MVDPEQRLEHQRVEQTLCGAARQVHKRLSVVVGTSREKDARDLRIFLIIIVCPALRSNNNHLKSRPWLVQCVECSSETRSCKSSEWRVVVTHRKNVSKSFVRKSKRFSRRRWHNEASCGTRSEKASNRVHPTFKWGDYQTHYPQYHGVHLHHINHIPYHIQVHPTFKWGDYQIIRLMAV